MKHRVLLTLLDVWDGIRTQPARFGLSLAAIAIGILSLTILLAILNGLEQKSEKIVRALGINVIGILRQEGSEESTNRQLRQRHAAFLARNLENVAIATIRRYNVPTLGTARLTTVVATDDALVDVRQWRLHDGRFIDREDVRNHERNVVISRRLSELWNWKVGNVVLLGNLAFNVVGIVEVAGAALDTETGDAGLILGERVAFVPRTVEPYWLGSEKRPRRIVDAIFVRVPSSEAFDRVLTIAQRLLSQPDQRIGPVSWVTPASLIQGVERLRDTIGITIGSISLLSLVLGGTVLMSLMVTNVRDRVAEIGLRRALGATRRDIAMLFVLEAGAVTAVAGMIGTLGAYLLLTLGRHYVPVPIKFGLNSLLIPLGVAVLLGIAFAYWPAKAAAKINPVQALREE